MGNHYVRRFDLSKYTLKSFDSADEFCADTNNSDVWTYDANGTTKYLAQANPNVNSGLLTGDATVTLTPGQSGQIFLFDNASGGEYDLPAPAPGLNYIFMVTVSVTSNDYEITTNNPGTVLYAGGLWLAVAGTAGSGNLFVPNGSTQSAIIMDGATHGGLINSIIQVYALNSTTWFVDGSVIGTATVATPFGAS